MFEINSAPQENLDNQTFVAYAGKVLGGGSIVNGLSKSSCPRQDITALDATLIFREGMGYDRGTQPDYDAWGELGNTGWTWDNLLTYFKRVSQTSNMTQCTTDPNSEQHLHTKLRRHRFQVQLHLGSFGLWIRSCPSFSARMAIS